jgi:hypothetical protein
MTYTDERLDDLPMMPVECARCQAVVRVRKSSWEQTSIQWDDAGVRACVERGRVNLGGVKADDFITCAGLREAIEAGAKSGSIPLADDSPLNGGGPAGATAEERAVAQ